MLCEDCGATPVPENFRFCPDCKKHRANQCKRAIEARRRLEKIGYTPHERMQIELWREAIARHQATEANPTSHGNVLRGSLND